ncbi:1,4-alpha-glucan branching protein [Thermococcus barophilus]|uniref:1,4-alpha-glucan branching enzyme n=1 Tax=Thermococcus barophilus (strain DSM 11836 / MP) TaxID=391623 RepID=F0LMB1_THEBM|nr:1,4-alpha-glucan branching protein [Thermococcus barophilus]ADT85134.1 glycogen branching enzyme [Thermococcus barophilus MP]
MAKGYFTFVLHTHIPYVRKHGKWPFGEEWIFEAIAESYIPLLMEFERLKKKGVKFQLVIGITPILAEQLADDYIKAEFEKYMERKLNAMREDLKKFENDEKLRKAVEYMLNYFEEVFEYWKKINGDIIGKFKQFQDGGYIEIITSAATHGYLPLLGRDEAIEGQLVNGILTYEKHFGRKPNGIWLPECAYRPEGFWQSPSSGEILWRKGLEKFLEKYNLKFFFVESHLIDEGPASFGYGKILPAKAPKSTLRPYFIKGTNIAVFARNRETGLQVWSADIGYPGDFWYREFHKKAEKSGGQYWRVTGKHIDLGDKEPYVPEKALERTEEHAKHFVSLVRGLLENYERETGEKGIVVAPYDTELFGHWWFEGVKWLGRVLELMSEEGIETTAISRFLESYRGERYEIELPEGSWGMYGTHYTWWNPEVEWMWEHIHKAEDRMVALVSKYLHEHEFGDRVLEQLGRELLLIESSDWPFLITTGQAKEYGKRRLLEHANVFHRLANALEEYFKSGEFREVEFLEEIEKKDNPFHPINIEVYVSEEPPSVPEYVEPPEIPKEKESSEEKTKVANEVVYSYTVIQRAYAMEKIKRKRIPKELPKLKRRKSKKKRNIQSELLKIKGIGSKTLKKLEKAGIRTLNDLKSADLEDLARRTKISVKRLKKFVSQIP